VVQFTLSMTSANTTGSNILGNRGADAAPTVTRMHNARSINSPIINPTNRRFEGVWLGLGSVGRIPRPGGAQSKKTRGGSRVPGGRELE